MIPFLKRKEAAASGDEDSAIVRDHDEGFKMSRAIAEDMMQAFKSGSVEHLEAAIDTLIDHIEERDAEADQELVGEK